MLIDIHQSQVNDVNYRGTKLLTLMKLAISGQVSFLGGTFRKFCTVNSWDFMGVFI